MKATFKVTAAVPGIGGQKATLKLIEGDFKSARPDGLLMLTMGEGTTLNANDTVAIEITPGQSN